MPSALPKWLLLLLYNFPVLAVLETAAVPNRSSDALTAASEASNRTGHPVPPRLLVAEDADEKDSSFEGKLIDEEG